MRSWYEGAAARAARVEAAVAQARAYDADALEAGLRERLAGRWAQTALAEHASIASFSRFSLHLLAAGAPQAARARGLRSPRTSRPGARA